MDYLNDLNEKQQEAVLATEGYVRVIAGAGSGKTKLLVSRYAYLVEEYGIDPSNILCVTFTNKAAGEMKKRIRTIIGEQYDTALICTYHGFCARLLREDAEKLFLSRDFQIIDAVQQKTILGEIYQKRELKLDYASFEKILKQIGNYKSVNYSTYVERMCDPNGGQILTDIKTLDDEIMEEYMQRERSVGALDFHDLLSFALYLLESNSQVRDKWQEKLNYIQVDEFQDSSVREMKLVDILSQKYQNLMIVGDPDQNIYEWRGSDVRLLVDFDKQHEPTQTIFLTRNYRSTPQILACANCLIDKNTLRLKKDLFTLSPDGGKVIHYHSKSDEEETEHIARIIKQTVLNKDTSYSEIAVLYRSGFLSRMVENKLVEKNIPYEIYGGVKFYQRMEVLDIIAYLRLIAFDDDVSLKRIINKPRRRFGRVKLSALEELQERQGFADDGAKTGLFELLEKNLNEAPFKNSDAAEFVKLINEIRAECGKLHITDIVDLVTVRSGYEEYIRKLGDEERYENLMEFKRIADEFERGFGEDLTLPEFLQQIALQAGEDENSSRDAVKLMTIHAAKGLEFPVVFVIGFTEGIFPSSKTIEERKQLGLEEERRLCYVALTRAEKQLYIMDSEGFSQNGIKKLPSRFLREIGDENYVRIGVISNDLDRESRMYTRRLNEGISENEENAYSVGDTVEHHAFGKGKVISADKRRGTVLVQFEKLRQPRNLSVDYFKRVHTLPTLKKTSAPPESAEEPHVEQLTEDTFEQFDEEKPLPSEDMQIHGSHIEQADLQTKPSPPREEIREEDARFALSEPERTAAYNAFPDYDEPKLRKEEERFALPEPEQTATDIAFPDYDEPMPHEEEDRFALSEPERTAAYNAFPDYDEPMPREEEDRFALSEPKQAAAYSAFSDYPDYDEPEEDLAESKNGIDPKLLEKLANTANLWKRDDVPHSGWSCTGVTDLGSASGVCEMCGYQIIRYVHHMVHPNYRPLDVGCICAGKMEGDIAAAKKRERDFKNKEARRASFGKRQWKNSRNGNPYLKIKDHIVVLFQNKKGKGWKYSIDSQFGTKIYPTKSEAAEAAFEALEHIRS